MPWKAAYAASIESVQLQMLKVWMYQALRLFSHSGMCCDHADQRDELRRQQHRGRDQEDDRRVVRLVARRAHDEELRDGSDRAEDDERRPARRVRAQPRQQRQRDGRRDGGDDEEVHRRPWRRASASRSSRRRARSGSGPRSRALPARVVLGSKLVIGPLTVSSSSARRAAPQEHEVAARGEHACRFTTSGSYVARTRVTSPFFGTARISPERGRAGIAPGPRRDSYAPSVA